jgi:hypothetical protein
MKICLLSHPRSGSTGLLQILSKFDMGVDEEQAVGLSKKWHPSAWDYKTDCLNYKWISGSQIIYNIKKDLR